MELIQKEHIRLHERNLASAGAISAQIVEQMIQAESISLDNAKKLLQQI